MQENVTAPLVSPSATAIEEVQDVPEPLYEGVLAIAAPPDENVQVGCWMASELVIVRDTVSPLFASPSQSLPLRCWTELGQSGQPLRRLSLRRYLLYRHFQLRLCGCRMRIQCSARSRHRIALVLPSMMFGSAHVGVLSVYCACEACDRLADRDCQGNRVAALRIPAVAVAGGHCDVGQGRCVLSTVTLELSVVAVTAVPALPAESVNAIEKATAPSESASAVSRTQVQSLFCGLATVIKELSAIASPPEVNVQVGLFWT